MRKLYSLIIFCMIVFLWQNILIAGESRFSGDPLLFPEELTDFMGSNLNEEQVLVLEDFIMQWNSEVFTKNEMQVIVDHVTLLTARNARPVPHMINYLEMLSDIFSHEKGAGQFDNWQRALNVFLENESLSLQKINGFITLARRLISENELYRSGSVTWKVTNPDFSFIFGDSIRIVFGETDLKGSNHADTLMISGTSGILYPLENIWKGKRGRVSWERAGLSEQQAYGVLSEYKIDLSRYEYIADSVLFTYNLYLQAPVAGRLTDRLMSNINSGNASYPRFTSYGQEFNVRDIYRNIDYEGGLSMEGAKLIGSGGENDNARLVFYREGERWLTAESKHFVFNSQGVNSISTSIVFSIENDSVFHPDLQLNYLDESRELSLNQNDKVISQSPWYNQFHKVDMSFGQLLWKIDGQQIILTMPRASSIGNADFKSLNFFNRNHYLKLQGMDAAHPLLLIKKFAEKDGSSEFSAGEYAKFIRMPVSRIRHQLLELTLEGFVFYDTGSDLIRVRQRLYDYLKANIRRIDYDIINFSSTVDAPLENAVIDLDSNDLKINGIPRVYISNTQNVNIFPEKSTVTLKENRNFRFDGTINAGNLSFFGSNYFFDYDGFNINLQNVDSISLRAQLEEKDEYGRARLTSVKNLIRNVTGELIIDKPFNKSGRVDHPDYPKFGSTENSYVFYDEPEIQNGVYGQEDFYYELYPFVMDSLNTFQNEELRFRGRLVSAGIFPDIEEMLVLMDDYSLGIKHSAPEAGHPVYGEKGTYYYDLQLSNRGLRGSGKLDYLASEMYSEDFLFFPDSMNAITNDFFVIRQTAGTEFPAVSSKDNTVRWLPDEDIITVLQNDAGFSIFNNQAELNGSLEITPGGLQGAGSLELENAEIFSDNYSFEAESLLATSSRFVLRDPEKPDIVLNASGLNSYIDLEKREGEFSRNRESGLLSMPLNKYTADPESFTWDMNRQEFEFISSETYPETGLTGAEYISEAKGQDSVRFFSPHAVMNYSEHLLVADEVKYIEIADATIFPSDETLTIGENAEIFPLKDARVSANRENSLHEIYNAEINITAKNEYNGSGSYDYRNELDEVQTIYFDEISVNQNTETIASGEVNKSNNFMLSPRFSFAGEAELLASRNHLSFNGVSGLPHNCDNLNSQELAFENIIDPMEILIPVSPGTLSGEGERIYSGIFIATDSVHIYPAFLTERKNYADQLIITADGHMKFEPGSGEYRIGSMEKLRDPSTNGNILTFNPDECLIWGEGQLEMGVTFGQLQLKATGSAYNRVNINETSIEGTINIDFPFSEDAIGHMAHAADSIGSEPVDSNSYYFKRGLNEILGKQQADDYRSSIESESRQFRVPAELQKTFVLSDVRLNWNKESRSYISRGKIGIAYIGGIRINKMFTGYLEITKRRSGDYIDLYLELDKNNWYYFGYTRGVMQAYSSDTKFIGIIDDLALRHRRERGSGAEERYVYMLATDTKQEQFFSRYQQYKDNEENEINENEQSRKDVIPDAVVQSGEDEEEDGVEILEENEQQGEAGQQEEEPPDENR